MNLIFQKVKYQDKDLLELLKNVKVILIDNFMQLNEFKLIKENKILKKFKLHQNYNKQIKIKIQYNNMIFIIEMKLII